MFHFVHVYMMMLEKFPRIVKVTPVKVPPGTPRNNFLKVTPGYPSLKITPRYPVLQSGGSGARIFVFLTGQLTRKMH